MDQDVSVGCSNLSLFTSGLKVILTAGNTVFSYKTACYLLF